MPGRRGDLSARLLQLTMKAIVTKPFRGAPDGEPHVRDFAVGDVVEGDLARVALMESWAVPEGAPAVEQRETQALGGAPEPFRAPQKPAVRRRRERAQPHA